MPHTALDIARLASAAAEDDQLSAMFHAWGWAGCAAVLALCVPAFYALILLARRLAVRRRNGAVRRLFPDGVMRPGRGGNGLLDAHGALGGRRAALIHAGGVWDAGYCLELRLDLEPGAGDAQAPKTAGYAVEGGRLVARRRGWPGDIKEWADTALEEAGRLDGSGRNL